MFFCFSLAGLALAQDVTPRQLIDNGHYNRARAILEPRLATSPNDAEALCLMSRLKSLSGDDQAALPLAEQAVKLDSRNPLFELRLVEVLANLVDRAPLSQQLKLGNQLKSAIQAVLSLDPNNTGALKYRESIYRNAPVIFGGSKTKAREVADQIMQIDPVQGYFLEAEIAGAQKQSARVEECYRKAVEANPASQAARVRLAYYSLANLKDSAGAEFHSREAVRLNPDRIDGYNVLAAVLALQGKWDDLDALLAQAQKAIPDNLEPYVGAAVQILSRGSDLPRAERYLQTYLAREPELLAASPARARWRLGQVYEKESRIPEAVAAYQAVLALDPTSPAKGDLARLQRAPAAAPPPAYVAAHFAELVRTISAGADSLERAQAIELQLARLRIPFESRPFEINGRQGTNLIASLPSSNPSAPVLMLGAHLDRVAEGQGAVDNASGDAAVLELLAALKSSPPKDYRIVAAFWDREEDGLLGSESYVASQPRDRLPAVYFNFDMFGYGDALCAYWKDEQSKSAQAFRQAAGPFPLRTDFEFPPSDDRPFVSANVEVVAIALASRREIEIGLKAVKGETTETPRILLIMHSAEDTPDKVAPDDAVRALPFVERAIRLRSTPDR